MWHHLLMQEHLGLQSTKLKTLSILNMESPLSRREHPCHHMIPDVKHPSSCTDPTEARYTQLRTYPRMKTLPFAKPIFHPRSSPSCLGSHKTQNHTKPEGRSEYCHHIVDHVKLQIPVGPRPFCTRLLTSPREGLAYSSTSLGL
ncbi:hypothetical protein TorRG33x02_174720 [Trema orientale]|uniref:Uncharacterized protein n=1 Tax=Trema orientale TaxID=63057 RepID=A0A2P5EMM1_TREOI|nr:hypothetical protein TorRG33x02_174720 [Trema orientale]